MNADSAAERTPTSLSGFTAGSTFTQSLPGTLVYLTPLIALLLPIASHWFSQHGAMLLGLGLIGIWRYSWATAHYVRAWIYRAYRFPMLRAATDPQRDRFDHIAVLITSFRIDAEVNATVYAALFRELLDYGARATVVACVTDPADAQLLRSVGQACGCEGRMDVVVMAQAGLGKRHAMGRALRHLASRSLPSNTAVVLMDGDTLLRAGTLERSLPILQRNPQVGAITTDNLPLVRGTAISREWYRLRMAQRHLLMCSISLSNRLLVLTGRFSVFRASVACQPGFASQIADDEVQHWRFGHIQMLSGDDKSSWYWVLSRGWKMLYVPDVSVYCLEELPSKSFFRGSTALMKRWFGNMVRNSGRALDLGWRRTGVFPWFALLDQRLSLWTALVGPTLCLALTLLQGPQVLVLYLIWVILVRTAQSMLIGLFAGRFNVWFPLLLYHGQMVGSAIKIWATFHPNVQKWTRQSISGADSRPRTSSTLLMWLTVAVFIAGVIVIGGVLDRAL